ncbi:MAG: hypothetical protein AAFZ07_25650 [Actinomycetota bacterium]
MQVAELLELLEEADPTWEVRLATQPAWPFEWTVGSVMLPSGVMDQLTGLEADELEESGDRLTQIVWISTGAQVGYAPAAVARAVWSG